jgi:hypothetical protein
VLSSLQLQQWTSAGNSKHQLQNRKAIMLCLLVMFKYPDKGGGGFIRLGHVERIYVHTELNWSWITRTLVVMNLTGLKLYLGHKHQILSKISTTKTGGPTDAYEETNRHVAIVTENSE